VSGLPLGKNPTASLSTDSPKPGTVATLYKKSLAREWVGVDFKLTAPYCSNCSFAGEYAMPKVPQNLQLTTLFQR
jgi:hypothetical protein